MVHLYCTLCIFVAFFAAIRYRAAKVRNRANLCGLLIDSSHKTHVASFLLPPGRRNSFSLHAQNLP